MKILLITWACDLDDVSEPGVSARWVSEISKDHEVTVFAVSRPERYGCVKAQFPHLNVIEWMDSKVPKCLIRFRAIVKPAYFLYYIRARRFIAKLIKEQKFDVIHHLSPFAWRYPSPAAGLGVPLVRGPIAGGLKTPACFSSSMFDGFNIMGLLRKTDGLRIHFDKVLRKSYQNIDHLLIAAPYVREVIAQLPSPKNISVELELGLSSYPSGVINSRENNNYFSLIFVGRVIKTKGLFLAIKALQRVKSKDVRLVVVGDGDDLLNCKALVEHLGLDDKVEFLGWKTRIELDACYRSAHAFIFPSYREPTGGVLMEAMSYGLPIITCDYGGPGFIVDDSCGTKIKPKTEDLFLNDIADAIDELNNNMQLYSRLSDGAFQRAKDMFSWQEKRKRISSLYLNLIKNS